MYAIAVDLVSDPPPAVDNIRRSEICLETSVIVSWDPVPVCGPVLYDVTISPSDGVVMMRITDTSYNFTGLTPDNSYTVTVAGRNDAGMGESSMIMFNKPNMNEAVPSGEYQCWKRHLNT